jgi:DNA-binding Lrp family transcriptional regulator
LGFRRWLRASLRCAHDEGQRRLEFVSIKPLLNPTAHSPAPNATDFPIRNGSTQLGRIVLFGKITNLMPTAIVMLKTDRKRVTRIAEHLLELRDVSEVYSVSGRFDILVVIRCDSIDKIEGVITDELLRTDGIIESETMFAFRSYDKREGGRAIDVD